MDSTAGLDVVVIDTVLVITLLTSSKFKVLF